MNKRCQARLYIYCCCIYCCTGTAVSISIIPVWYVQGTVYSQVEMHLWYERQRVGSTRYHPAAGKIVAATSCNTSAPEHKHRAPCCKKAEHSLSASTSTTAVSAAVRAAAAAAVIPSSRLYFVLTDVFDLLSVPLVYSYILLYINLVIRPVRSVPLIQHIFNIIRYVHFPRFSRLTFM